MSSSKQPTGLLLKLEFTEPIIIGSTLQVSLDRAEVFKNLVKVCENALSLSPAIGFYTCTVLVTLFEINYKVKDAGATLGAALIVACRKYKTRRSLPEILTHVSAPIEDTLMALWDLEHLDVTSRTMYSRRQMIVTCEESSKAHAFSLLDKDGSTSKVAVTLTWSDDRQFLLDGQYTTFSNKLRNLHTRAMGLPTPVIMTPKEIEGVRKEEKMEEIELSEDEVDDWEEITAIKCMRGAQNGKPLIQEDGEIKKLVDRVHQGLVIGVEFVEKMVNGDTSLIKGDTPR